MKLKGLFEERPIFKWIYYLIVGLIGGVPIAYCLFKINQNASGTETLLLLFFIVLPSAVFLVITLTPLIAEKIAAPFGSIFTGNPNEIEDRPIYGPAKSSRNQGDYNQSLHLIDLQLEKYPLDFDGLMLKAEIQAEDYLDFDSAKETLNIILNNSQQIRYHLPIVFNKLADWQIKLFNDNNGARQSLERICTEYPDTKAAQLAQQRIASMKFYNESKTKESNINDTYQNLVKESLSKDYENEPLDFPESKKQSEDNENLLIECLRRVKEYPNSIINREELARYYCVQTKEWPLAIEQYELLISMSGSSKSQHAAWLNKIVDIQVKSGTTIEEAKSTLSRIIEIDPISATAEKAKRRIMHLSLEFRSVKKKNTPLKLERRDEDLGLK